VIWWKWWRFDVKPLAEYHSISLQDMIVIAVVVIDFCQYLALGPSFESLNSLVYKLANSGAIDLGYLVEMEEGVYWIILNVVYSLCFVWFLCGIMITFKLDLKFENNYI
jgi:hypothetical protein